MDPRLVISLSGMDAYFLNGLAQTRLSFSVWVPTKNFRIQNENLSCNETILKFMIDYMLNKLRPQEPWRLASIWYQIASSLKSTETSPGSFLQPMGHWSDKDHAGELPVVVPETVGWYQPCGKTCLPTATEIHSIWVAVLRRNQIAQTWNPTSTNMQDKHSDETNKRGLEECLLQLFRKAMTGKYSWNCKWKEAGTSPKYWLTLWPLSYTAGSQDLDVLVTLVSSWHPDKGIVVQQFNTWRC